MAIRVRRVAAGDWPELKAIRLRALATDPRAFASTLAREQAFDDQVWIDRARASGVATDVATWIGEDDAGQMLGMMGAHLGTDGAMLFGTWVDPRARGAGLGGQLLDSVLDWIASVAPGSAVKLAVNPELRAAVRLYQSRRFVRTGASQPLEHAPGASIDEMVLVVAR